MKCSNAELFIYAVLMSIPLFPTKSMYHEIYPKKQLCLSTDENIHAEECYGSNSGEVQSFIPGSYLFGNSKLENVSLDTLGGSVPLARGKSFFFVTVECNVAFSNGFLLCDKDSILTILKRDKRTNIVFIVAAATCSNVNYTAVGLSQQINGFDKDYINQVSVMRSPFITDNVTPSVDTDSSTTSIIFDWLRSWSTLWRPTVEILHISYPARGPKDPASMSPSQLFSEYSYLDAAGTYRWANNRALTKNVSCPNGVLGICGDLIFVGDACNYSFIPAVIDGTKPFVALAVRGLCSFSNKARNVQLVGYIGLIIYQNVDEPKFEMIGDGEDASIPVLMIDREPGHAMFTFLSTAANMSVRLFFRHAPVSVACIDMLGAIRELGYPWTNLTYVIIAQAEYQLYYFNLQRAVDKLKNETDAVVVADRQRHWDHTILTLPDSFKTAAFESLHVHFDAQCLGGWDGSCPQWDKLLSLYLCVADVSDPSLPCINDYPIVELLKSVTSYSRPHAGLVDVSPLLFFFASVRSAAGDLRNIRVSIYGTTNFIFTVTLYFKRAPTDVAYRDQSFPLAAFKLWFGDDGLTATYNQRQPVKHIGLPSYTVGIDMAAYITGHGWGAGDAWQLIL